MVSSGISGYAVVEFMIDTSGDALGRAVNEIHQRRIAERQRLAGELLASLEPELVEKVAAFVRAGGGATGTRDFRPLFGGWTDESVAVVKEVLYP